MVNDAELDTAPPSRVWFVLLATSKATDRVLRGAVEAHAAADVGPQSTSGAERDLEHALAETAVVLLPQSADYNDCRE
ncbi:hypothetical protein [Streptomyces sp. NPDC006334]|uniref:hypothetical protein n=1 Tax=Streptomyces sp. NPDC006334 TaxID=3156754 RepID=UPI0033AE6EFC